MKNKTLKYIIYVLLSFVLFILLCLGFTQTPIARGWLRAIVEREASGALTGTCTITSIEGNLFTNLELKGIRIMRGEDTIFTATRVSAEYEFFEFFSRRIHVTSLVVESPGIFARQHSDKSWNLIPGTPSSPSGTTSSPWHIALDDIRLGNADVRVQFHDSSALVPRRITHLNAALTFSSNQSGEEIELKHLEFEGMNPELQLRNCSGLITIDSSRISVRDMRIETAKNSIQLSGYYPLITEGAGFLHLSTSSINLTEFGRYSFGIDTSFHPSVILEATMRGDSISTSINVSEQMQRADVHATISLRTGSESLTAESEFSHINPARILTGSLPSMDLNGQGNISTSLSKSKTGSLNFGGMLTTSTIYQRKIEYLKVSGRYEKTKLTATGDVQGPAGHVKIEASVTGLQALPRTRATVSMNGLNVGSLLRSKIPETKLHGVAVLDAEGLDVNNAQGVVEVTLDPSIILGEKTDSVYGFGRFHNKDVSLEQFHLSSSAAMIDGEGEVARNGAGQVHVRAFAQDLSRFRHLLNVDSIAGRGELRGEFEGTVDSMNGTVDFRADSLRVHGVTSIEASGNVEFSGAVRKPSLRMLLKTRTMTTLWGSLDSADARVEYSGNKGSLALAMSSGDTVKGTMSCAMEFDSSSMTLHPDLAVRLYGETWKTTDPSPTIIVGKGFVTTNNFELTNGSQKIVADGIVEANNESDFKLNMTNFYLSSLRPILQTGRAVDGTAGVEVRLRGKMTNPMLTASATIEAIRMGKDTLGTFRGSAELSDSIARWHIVMARDSAKAVRSDGALPVRLHRTGADSYLDRSREGSVHLSIDPIDLSGVQLVPKSIDELRGLLSADVTLRTGRNPLSVQGFLMLKEGSLKSRRYGLDYPSIVLDVRAESSRAVIKELLIAKPQGSMRMTGVIDSLGALVEGRGVPFGLSVAAKNFEIGKSNDYQLAVDAGLSLRNNPDSLSLNGAVTVLRSRWNLTTFMKQFQKSQKDVSRPMLVEASGIRDTVVEQVKDTTLQVAIRKILRKLRGSVRLSMPRNSTVDNPNLHADIISDIVVSFVDSLPVLNGTIDIQRGWVQAYGVRFTFSEGKITFNGGVNPIPFVHFVMEYSFRDPSREKKVMEVKVDGYAKDPLITFTMDGKVLTEKDAVSVIVLGYVQDDLTTTPGGESSDRGNQLVDQITSSIVSARLSSTLGRSLGLDVVDVRGEESWSKVSLTAGKYLTDRLLMTYEKGFGDWQSGGETAPQTLTLEYELYKFLFVQLVNGEDTRSGVNVMVKVH